MDTNELFEKASKHARLFRNISENDTLKLYGLFKQANTGACSTPKPRMWEFIAKAKWESWNHLGNMSQDEAKEKYIELVKFLDPDWDENSDDDKSSGGLGISVSCPTRDPEDQIDECDKTVFDWCKEGVLDKLEYVVSKDKNILNIKDEDGLTLLHWAVDHGHVNVSEFLIQSGSDINAQDSELQTALHYAVTCGHNELILLLIDNGANQQLKDQDGNIPSFYCDDDDMKSIFNNAT